MTFVEHTAPYIAMHMKHLTLLAIAVVLTGTHATVAKAATPAIGIHTVGPAAIAGDTLGDGRLTRTGSASSEDIRYAVLLGLSEEVEPLGASVPMGEPTEGSQAPERIVPRRSGPALPRFEGSVAGSAAPAPLAREIQLATAYRLRGEYREAEALYSSIVRLSDEALHAFFLAECATANGHALLAEHARTLYRERRSAGETRATSRRSTDIAFAKTAAASVAPVRLAAVVRDGRAGVAVAGCSVRVLDPIALREHSARTDANGLVVVDGLSAGATLYVEATRGELLAMAFVELSEAATRHAPLVGAILHLGGQGVAASGVAPQ